MTQNDKLAAYLKARPNQWLGAREMEVGGRQSWRTRLSNLRKPPYNMRIENRVRVVRSDKPLLALWESRTFKVSEYRFVPAQNVLDSAPEMKTPGEMKAPSV
jgi:hypothetical protein